MKNLNWLKKKLREPSTWTGSGQGLVLLTLLFGPVNAVPIALAVQGLIAVVDIVRGEHEPKSPDSLP